MYRCVIIQLINCVIGHVKKLIPNSYTTRIKVSISVSMDVNRVILFETFTEVVDVLEVFDLLIL